MTRREEDNKLIKTFIFSDFTCAFSWMQKVAIECEKIHHHPTRTNTYSTVFVQLTTHDQGNTITEKDHELAKVMDTLYSSHK